MRPTVILVLFLLSGIVPALATEAGWAALREGGKVVLLRHADALGTGDPANFELEDCSTQRNLSDRGRQQARRIGALFAARAAPVERVLSSRYCRALETARLAFGDQLLEPFPALDVLSTDPETEAEQIETVIERIRQYSGTGNLVMVTHPSNMAALTGISPRGAEAFIVALQEDRLTVIARIIFN
jgi:phosphohistidine phosphatase SixA